MKLKRIVLLVLAFALAGTAVAFADEAAEMYKGSKVKVTVNGKPLNAPGILLNVDGESKTMLPTRDIADILQAMVQWDEKKQSVNIYKPNVHIALTTKDKDGTIGMFGSVYYKNQYDFYIFAQIDNLTTDIQAMKFEIVDPFGNVVYEKKHELEGIESEMLWVRSPVSMKFDYLGNYKARVYMKPAFENQFFLVSEKVIESKQG